MALDPQSISALLSDPNTAPYLGGAMGLLGSSGASRLPVTMGAAMGNALSGSQQYSQQVLQNELNRMMLGYKSWLLGQMQGGQQTPSQSITDLNQGKTPNATPNEQQLSNLNKSDTAPSPNTGNLLLAPSPGSALQVPAPGQPSAPQANQQSDAQPQPSQQPGLFPGMSPSERLTMLSGLFTDPGRLASTMYANNPAVKAAESALAIDQQMMALATQNNDASSYRLWQTKAYNDAGALKSTYGGIANVAGMLPGESLAFGKPPPGTNMINGRLVIAPGALPAIEQTEAAYARGQTFGHPIPIVDPVTGATIGYTSAGQSMGYGVPVPELRMPTNGQQPAPPNPQQPAAITRAPVAPPVYKIGPAQATGQETIGKQATDQLTDAITQQATAQQSIAQLGELSANLGALNTSAAKPAQIAIEKLVNGIGTTLGMKPFNVDVTNAQAAQKTIINFTAAATRVMGAREAYQVMDMIKQGYPSMANTPQANQIVAGMLHGLAEYANARGLAAQKWQAKYGSGYVPGVGTFQGNWQKQASPLAFMMDSFPEFEQQAIVQAAQKNATLRYDLQQAAKSKAAMQKQGFWPSQEQQ